jgi:ATP-binding cassette, subfamily B, bacterial PglK
MLISNGVKKSLPVLLKRLWHYFSVPHKLHFFLLLGLMILSAMSEVVTLGAVLPFIGVLTAPEQVFSYPMVSRYANLIGVHSANEMVLPLTIIFFVLIFLATTIRLVLLWATTRLTLTSGVELSLLAYKKTLYQPYLVHVGRNSSEVISGLATKVNSVVFGIMMSFLVLLSSIFSLAAITVSLFVINPEIAILSAIVLGISYLTITWLSRHRLERNSREIAVGQTMQVKTIQDGLGGIRDIILDGTQEVYCDIYQQSDLPLRQSQCNNTFIAQSPRYIMEALGMMLIAGLAYSLSLQSEGIGAAIPMLGALALGAQRLLPALQQAYSAWISIGGNKGALIDIVGLLDQEVPKELLTPPPPPLEFRDEIKFSGVRFRYPNTDNWVLDDLNFTLPKGARVGFVGSTGSGKSTAIDLLMGLLPATEGQVEVDGKIIQGDLTRSWQRTIAHVPQSIYLKDASILENIAFGVPFEQVDVSRVKAAARLAQIAEFIEAGKEGYETLVGERGIRLSGGQRQRIGIARALYKEASVLVFDEATSALDNATEQSVMNTIESLNRNLTVVIIAHRLTTVQHCDFIIQMEHGKVTAQGTFQELLDTNEAFSKMVSVSKPTTN